MSKTVQEVCLAAADYIEQNGLVKGTYGRAGGPCCVLGAIRIAVMGKLAIMGSDPPKSLLYERCREKVTDVLGMAIAPWNDSPETTKEEAVDLLRRTAAATENDKPA